MTMPSAEQLKKWFKDHYDRVLEDFFTFLSIPSISTDLNFKQDCRAAAMWLRDYLQEIGLEATLWETPGNPVVFAKHMKAGKDRPTLLIYHHYDVQPVDPLELWKSDPFKPVIRNNQVYARGAVDNKGQCFYSLTAMKAFFELASVVNFNLKVMIEGEEESGGGGTAEALKHYGAELQADHLLVVDCDIPSLKTPAVTFGMRGMVALEIECSNSSVDLHSGLHGGIALNPNRALASILAGIWDKSGKVTIPGFYDEVKSLSKAHLSLVDTSFDQEDYSKSFGVRAFACEEGYSPREANWLRPTVEINGINGGYTGPGFKTVIPAKAYAKISCRLVPDQDPVKIEKALTNYLVSSAPKGIGMKVHLHHAAPAFRSNFDSFIVKTSVLAYEEVFGKPCQYIFSGGSIPIVIDLARVSGAEVALIGVGLAEDDIHAPNEHFGLDRFELGYLVIGRILSGLSAV